MIVLPVKCCITVAGSGTAGGAASDKLHAHDVGQHDGTPPLEALLDRVKRDPSPALQGAHAASRVEDSPVSRPGGRESRSSSGSNGSGSNSLSIRNGSHPSAIDSEASVRSTATSSSGSGSGSSNGIKNAGSSGTSRSTHQNSAVSNGAVPSAEQRDAGWWRRLPYVVVPVMHFAEDGSLGFVTAELASPGEYRAPHVLAFEVPPCMLHPVLLSMMRSNLVSFVMTTSQA